MTVEKLTSALQGVTKDPRKLASAIDELIAERIHGALTSAGFERVEVAPARTAANQSSD